jgi:hypothetical protein
MIFQVLIILKDLFLSMVKNATTLTTSQNKNLNGQHCFFPFRVLNIVTQSTTNGSNQLQTKVNTSK